MGNQIFDQYTYLHFATGITAYFWNVNLLNTIILHTIFEILENTNIGMKITLFEQIIEEGEDEYDSACDDGDFEFSFE